MINSIIKKKTSFKIDLNDYLHLIDFCNCICTYMLSGESLTHSFNAAVQSLDDGIIKKQLSFIVNQQKNGVSFLTAITQENLNVTPDLKSVLEIIYLCSKTGTNITMLLQNHCSNLKNTAENYIEQQAAKAPLKMLFPLVLFIVPEIFILVSAHAVVDFIFQIR